jgi:hypothetical protein
MAFRKIREMIRAFSTPQRDLHEQIEAYRLELHRQTQPISEQPAGANPVAVLMVIVISIVAGAWAEMFIKSALRIPTASANILGIAVGSLMSYFLGAFPWRVGQNDRI